MANDTVTIYCCGTGGHRGKTAKWAVPYLYSITAREERAFICDGPGGAPIRKAESILKAVETGSLPTAPTTGPFKNYRLGKQIKSWNKKFESTHGSGLGAKIGGTGTADNIVMALQWLWMQWYKERFTTINLCGWSRGAVTCIMLAHSIQAAGFVNENPNLKVNIFAFDPVPGSKNDFAVQGTFETTGRAGVPEELAECVANYSVILQETLKTRMKGVIKKDKNFVCVIPRPKSADTDVKVYPLPGGHGDAGKYNSDEGGGPIGKIGMHLAQSFLRRHGTEFSAIHTVSERELIELYAVARKDYSNDQGQKNAPSRYRAGPVENAFRQHGFYINQHHHDLISGHNQVSRAIDNTTNNRALSELQKGFLKIRFPKTLETLEFIGNA